MRSRRPPWRPGRPVLGTLLVALAAAGCSPGTGEPAPVRSADVTQVLTFQAYDEHGLLPNLVGAAPVSGTCQGGSAVHPGRADAWRCRAGDTAFDPCFANGTGEELACVTDPWAREVAVLRPATPLGRAGANRNDPGLPPWYLELADGTRCGRALPPSAYRCSAGGDAGEPDTSTSVWTVARSGSPGGPLRDPVRTAWY